MGEIEDDEAVDYLVSKGINKENATDAVARITGGRFALLNDYVADHQDGLTNDQILANSKFRTKVALVNADIKPTDKLFRTVSTGSLEASEAMLLVGRDKLSKLTRYNIIVIHPATGLVAFNSRHIQTFFTETGVLWPIVCCRSLLAHECLCLFGHRYPLSCTETFNRILNALICCCVS